MNNYTRNFIKSILLAEVIVFILFLISGTLLNALELNHHGGSFFSYRIRHMNYLPAWFILSMILMSVNGYWIFKLANLEGSFFTPSYNNRGQYRAAFPLNQLRLFALNFITIPILMVIFVIIRANRL